MELPETFEVAEFAKPNAPLTLSERPLILPRQGEILVKVLAAGICGTDLKIQTGEFGSSFPHVPGHEIVGEIAAVGEGEKKWKIGDRVGGGWHGGHDGTCRECRRGFFQICEKRDVNGVTRSGGFAEYVLLRAEALAQIPMSMNPAEVAPLLCAGVTVFNGIRRMNILAGELVVVHGLGGLGHLAVQYASKMGFSVVVLSGSSDKSVFAKDLGAQKYIDTSRENAVEIVRGMGGAALVVGTAPDAAGLAALVGACQPGGKILILPPCGSITFNSTELIVRNISIHGWPSGHVLDAEEAIAFAQNQGVKCLIKKFPLADAVNAYAEMESGNARFRSVLTMP